MAVPRGAAHAQPADSATFCRSARDGAQDAAEEDLGREAHARALLRLRALRDRVDENQSDAPAEEAGEDPSPRLPVIGAA